MTRSELEDVTALYIPKHYLIKASQIKHNENKQFLIFPLN